jgi:hypothetical protein
VVEPEPEEEFYPPDHHMHPSQLAADVPADAPADHPADDQADAQTELDLTTPRDDEARRAP